MADRTSLSDPDVRALTRELAALTAKVERLERGQRTSQLANSSVEDGYIGFNDAYGIQRVTIGRQIDGKFGWGAVNGDAPPRPTPPSLSAGPNGITIGWGGQFVGPAPSDFTHVKAYLSPVGPDFIPSDGNCVGHLLGNARLPVTPLPQTGHWCVLIAYNTSGVASEPSIVAGPITPGAVVATEILDGIVTETKLAAGAVTQAKLAAGSVGTAQIAGQAVDLSKLANGSVDATKIVDGTITPAKLSFSVEDVASIATYYQADPPTGDIPIGSLWSDSNDRNKLYRYSGSSWVEVSDTGITQALQAAQQAQTDAANALSTAAGAEAAVDGKVTVFYQTSPPSGANTGDLWLDTDDANKLYRWSGSSWVLVADTRIASALANAQTAQATADGKITAFYQGTAPASGMGVGDLWYNTASGNAVSRWNGTSWVALPLGSSALADNSIIAAKLASGAVTLGKLADGSVPAAAIVTDAVTADKIATGAVGSTELAAGSVIAGKVAANAIGANEIAANSIIAGKVAANAIGTNELAANSVVAGKIAADSINSTHIVAGAIQTVDLAADSVAAGKIAANAVTAREVQALSITGDRLAANTIDAGQIKAGAITASKLEAIMVLVNTIIAGDPNDFHLELGDAQTPILYWNNTETGFALSRDQTTGQTNCYLSGRVEFGNGSQIEQDYLDLCEQTSTGYQMPGLRQSRTLIYSEPVATPSPTPTWLSATGKNNLLYMSVLAANLAGSGAPTITVPAGWSVVRTVVGGASGSTRMTTYQVPGVSHTSSHTAEAISANVPCAWAIGLYEASGIQLSSPLDVSASAVGSSGTASSGTTGTPTQGNEFQIAVFGTPGAGTPGKSGFSAPTNGFSLVSEGGGYNGQGSAALTKIVTGAAAASTQATVTPSSPWLGIIATFRTAPAAPVPSAPPTATVRLFTQRRGGASTPFVIDSAANVYPIGRGPYCKVRLTGDFLLPANTDIYAQGSWTAAGDPWGMVAISADAGTYSNITVPLTGLYRVDYKTVYQQSTNTTSTIAGFITKNGRDAANNSIARDARKYIQDGGDGSPVQAHREIMLTANDVIYWGNFSSVNTNVYSGRLNIPTEITVTYLGIGG